MKIFHDVELLFDITECNFLDNRILAIYEVAIASNVLCRLGNPICVQRIMIEIKGFLEIPLKQRLERYLSETMNHRTSIRYNCVTKNIPVIIICNTDYTQYLQNTEDTESFNNECFLLYSKGLDSRLAYYLLTEKYLVYKVSWDEGFDNSQKIFENSTVGLSGVCNYSYIDTFDNDPWNDYGLYFIYLALILNKAVCNGVDTISIGLNKDDLLGYDIVSGVQVNSQCSQSKEFVAMFRELAKIYEVNLILPLEELTRIDICKKIIQEEIDITDSISCVFFDGIECGMCFSCFDKLTGLLIAFAECKVIDQVDILINRDIYYLMYNNQKVMTFKNDINVFNSLEKMPIDYILYVQINRIILGENRNCILSSKYSINNILKLLHNYSNHKIGEVLFPRTSALFNQYKMIDKDIFIRYMEK